MKSSVRKGAMAGCKPAVLEQGVGNEAGNDAGNDAGSDLTAEGQVQKQAEAQAQTASEAEARHYQPPGLDFLLKESNARLAHIDKRMEKNDSRAEQRSFYMMLAILLMGFFISVLMSMGGYWLYRESKKEVIPVASAYDPAENQLVLEHLNKHITLTAGNSVLALTGELDDVKKKLDLLLARKPEVRTIYKPVAKSAKSKKKKVRSKTESIIFEGEKLELIPFESSSKPSVLK